MLSMCEQKAAFFDTQAQSQWACAPYDQDEHDKLVTMLSFSGLKRGMKVLEPGSGSGRLTEIISKKIGPYGEVSALDFSEKMSGIARKRTEGLSNCRVIQGAAEDHLEVTQGYDMIICHNMFHHLEAKTRSLSLMGNALNNEGHVIIYHFFQFDQINDPSGKIHGAVMNDTIPHIRDMESICFSAGLNVDYFRNDNYGYFLKMSRKL